MKFIDYAKILIRSGNGGNGHVSFRKEKFVPKGGPDGGNGGKGGDVILEVNKNLNTLLDFRYRNKYEAEDGHKGTKYNCTGKNGKDLVIQVPDGTIVKNQKNDEIICDLSGECNQYTILFGGRGGKGNAEFVSSTRQVPRFAQPGEEGEELEIMLELKLIADVGLVGFPNAGKSTLISVLSAAKPKIADYPFTTLVPNLGIVNIGEYQQYIIADIPGLIEGASDGKGLGIQFLRHIERTKLLVFLIDAASEDPIGDYNTLRNELIKYNPDIDFKPKLITISKIDTVMEDRIKELKKLKFEKKIKPLLISSATHENIDFIKYEIYRMIKQFEEVEVL